MTSRGDYVSAASLRNRITMMKNGKGVIGQLLPHPHAFYYWHDATHLQFIQDTDHFLAQFRLRQLDLLVPSESPVLDVI